VSMNIDGVAGSVFVGVRGWPMGVERSGGCHQIVAHERTATDKRPPEREDDDGHGH